MEYRRASDADLEILWNDNISDNPGDSRWPRWKKEYIAYNQSGQAVTFCVADDGSPVGEGTLLFSSACSAIAGRKALCNDRDIANVNALRIRKAYEGKGYVSGMIGVMKAFAVSKGISKLTIGVEAKETRNLAIYLHWGFTEFVFHQIEDGDLILYLAQSLQ